MVELLNNFQYGLVHPGVNRHCRAAPQIAWYEGACGRPAPGGGARLGTEVRGLCSNRSTSTRWCSFPMLDYWRPSTAPFPA